ncbi:hypothetical protein BGZ96_012224 [Linnemannia gamsii]|uniref:Uncharacterized protein n=1 Tax=Linnemannia gamsii TaxID=64522 RepID=A0ABQ7JQT4_9FUNG|nr:hypothetical protein BGZ96_012224 [Linnemannia gamsii]
MTETTIIPGFKSIRLSFELVDCRGGEQERDKETVQFDIPLNNTDTIEATFALADEEATLDFLLEHRGLPQRVEESFPRYGGHVTFRSSSIPGGCYRAPFQENPDQASTSTFVALDSRSTTNHLYFIVDLLLREQGSEEEGRELIGLFGDPDSYPNNNDDSPYGNSDDSENSFDSEDSESYGSSEYWSETDDDEDQYVTDQREDVDVKPEQQEILDRAQIFFKEQYSYGTWMAWMQMNRDKVKPTEEGAEAAAKDTAKELTSMPSLFFNPSSINILPKTTSPSPESKSTVEAGGVLNFGFSQSDGECSKTPSGPSPEQGRNAKRTYGEVDDEDDDDDGNLFISSNIHYAFKKLRQ